MPILGYQVHLANYGWVQGFVYDGMATGTVGLGLRTEAIQITGLPDGVQYRAHVENYGWLPWQSNGGIAGTTGQARRMEAIQFQDTRNSGVQICARAHCESYGWLPVVSAYDVVGTTGQAKRLEGIQIMMATPTNSTPQSSRESGTSNFKDLASLCFNTAQCLGTIGAIAVECAETEMLLCPAAIEGAQYRLLSSCAQMVRGLGNVVQGEQYQAPPPPGITVIGPQNAPPPNWVPGGNSVRPGAYSQSPGGVVIGPGFPEIPVGNTGDDPHGGDIDEGGDDGGDGYHQMLILRESAHLLSQYSERSYYAGQVRWIEKNFDPNAYLTVS